MRRYVDEALSRGVRDVIDETRGELAEHAKMKVRAWRTAFPDFHTTIETLVQRTTGSRINVRDRTVTRCFDWCASAAPTRESTGARRRETHDCASTAIEGGHHERHRRKR
jgi:hypothetical protein